MVIEVVLLALILGELAWLFVQRSPPVPRAERYARWMRRAWVRFGLTSVVALLLLGRIDALWTMPAEFQPAAAWIGSERGDPRLIGAYAMGMAIGMLVANGGAVWVARRRQAKWGRAEWRPSRRSWLPDIAILEAGPGEAVRGTLLSLTAGLVEEPFFRLVLPLLIARVTGDALIAFAVSAVLFGLSHRYQGRVGVALTMLSGAVLSAIYLQTGSLWLAMAVHAAIDWNLLVVRPALVRRFAGRRFSSSAATPS